MRNKKNNIYLMLCCILLSWAAQGQTFWSSNIRKTQDVLPQADVFQFAKTNLAYIVMNNADTVQIHIKVTNERLRKRLLLNGLQVFIDTANKEEPRFTINFPSPRVTMPELQGKPYSEKNVNEQGIVEHLNLLGATVQKNDKEEMSQTVITNIDLAATGTLLYSITIPAKEFTDSSLAGRNISLGLLSVIPEEAQPKPMSNDATMNTNTNYLNPNLYSNRTGYATRSPLYYRSRVRYIPPDEGTNSWQVLKLAKP